MSTNKSNVNRQINPFAFPSETDARFTLLMFSALALAFALADPLLQLINPEASNAAYDYPAAPPEGLPTTEFFSQNISYTLKVVATALKGLAWPTILFVAILLLATLLYWDHPRRVRTQQGVRLLGSVNDPRLNEEISKLAVDAGLSDSPNVEIGNGLMEQDSQAFGIGQRKTLRLGGGTRLLLRKSPDTFRALVRHELAHIVNHDINRTYFTQALWIAIVLITITPLLLISTLTVWRSTFLVLMDGVGINDLKLLFLDKYLVYFWKTIQYLGLTVVVAWIWAGILRLREYYADWRAALWGSRSALAAILAEPGQPRTKKYSLFGFHPSRTERLSTLNNPRRLFEMEPSVPFITGMLTFLILDGMAPMMIQIFIAASAPIGNSLSRFILFSYSHPGAWMPFFRLAINLGFILIFMIGILLMLLPLALIAYLFSATLGNQVQRQAIADFIEHRHGIAPYLFLYPPAALVSIGVLAGLVASPFSLLVPNSLNSGFLVLFWILAFSVFVWLVLIRIRFFSQRILGTHGKTTSPVGKMRLLAALSVLGFLGVVFPFSALLVFIKGTIANHQNLGLAFGLVLIVTFLIPVSQAVTFAIHRLVLLAYRVFRPLQCPNCRKPLPHIEIVGTECPSCHVGLGDWLFVQ